MMTKRIVLIACLIMICSAISATDITVTNTNDTGTGSLREAITNAADGDIITVSLPGTITLSSELPVITKSITINGNTGGTTISGNNACRIFTVHIATGTVTLNGLNIINGHSAIGASAGLFAITGYNGLVVLNRCTFTGCHTEGSEAYGGAIATSADINMTNCTIYGNTAAQSGGALATLSECNLSILNCTFYNNHSSDGTGTGGLDITDGATVNIQNTILAGNTSGSSSVFSDLVVSAGGLLTSLGNNLSNTSPFLHATDQVNRELISDIRLTDIFEDVSSGMMVCGIQTGSMAIDQANNAAAPLTDQCGRSRVAGSDIGAFEHQAVAVPSLITQPVSDISYSTASGTGKIVDPGASAPFLHGIVWSSTSTTPDVTLTTKTEQAEATVEGSFTSSMTGLAPATKYYVRAYATNDNGTGYGNTVSFTTQNRILSIARADATPSNASAVSWTVTFAAGVTGLSADNFTITSSGLNDPIITAVEGSETTWTITAGSLSGTGTIGLNLTGDDGLNCTLNGLPFSGESYMIDTETPELTAYTPLDDATNVNLAQDIVLYFNEEVVAGNGYITIRKSDGTLFGQIAANDQGVIIGGDSIIVNTPQIFTRGTGYYVEIDASAFHDVTGNYFPGVMGSSLLHFTTVDVVINEVVTQPQQHWQSSAFAYAPGGTPGEDDEWIELLINSAGIDLSDWTIELLDGTDVIGGLSYNGAFAYTRYKGPGNFRYTAPGAYLVLCDVTGSASMDNNITIRLKDSGGSVVDEVTFNTIPSSASDNIYNESAQRFPNGRSTGNASDWTQGEASIGAVNRGPSVTLSASVTTIDENAGSTSITAALSAPSCLETLIDLSLSGTATPDADYSYSLLTITIPAGSLTGSITVNAIQDLVDEYDKTVIVDIASVTNGVEAGTQEQTITITDDDQDPSVILIISPSTMAEGGGISSIIALLSGLSEKTVTVTLGVNSNSTAAPEDYTIASTTLSVTPGATTAQTTITAVDNTHAEGDKTVIIDITAITNGIESETVQQAITIVDDEMVQLYITDPVVSTVKEYDGTTTAEITSQGTVTGIIDGDNLIVTATANYEDAEAGNGKKITVTYDISGDDNNKYIPLPDYVIYDGVITEKIHIAEARTTGAGCEGDFIGLTFIFTSGDPSAYRLSFGSEARAAGFIDVLYTEFTDNGFGEAAITFNIPESVAGGVYSAELQLENVYGFESQTYPFTFRVNLSSDYLMSKYNDVVFIDNSAGLFASYQWVKDGEDVIGANGQYYCDPDMLSGTYYARVKTTDGLTLETCPVTFNNSVGKTITLTVFPNPARPGEELTLNVEGLTGEELETSVISLFNSQGIKIFSSGYVSTLAHLDVTGADGMYIMQLTTADGRVLTKKIMITR